MAVFKFSRKRVLWTRGFVNDRFICGDAYGIIYGSLEAEGTER